METLTQQFFKESQKYIVDGVKGMHRISKAEEFPMYFWYGENAYVWDLDNRKYFDFVMGKGSYILGYRNKEVENAVIDQVQYGNLFPTGNPMHVYLAKKIQHHMPNMEKILFYKTGSCGTQAAIRFARYFTKKSRIFTSGYHGWHEWCKKTTEDIVDFHYDLEKLESEIKKSDDNAAVIVSPEAFYFSGQYYTELEHICNKYDILFILDEVKTGFRVGLSGFQGKYNLKPDLTIVSKAMANGYSISALGGRKEIMNKAGIIHTAGTFDTEVIPFAASLATINVLKRDKTLFSIENLGKWFCEELEKIFIKNDVPINIIWANGSFRFWFKDDTIEDVFYRKSIENGICFYPYDNSFISHAHDEKCLEKVIEIIDEKVVRNIEDKYSGFEEFSCENINVKYKNRKGFLDEYPGRDGYR